MNRWRILLTITALLIASCGSPGPTPGVSQAGPTAAKDPGPTALPTQLAASSAGETALMLAVWRDEDGGGTLRMVDAKTGADIAGHEPLFLGGNYWHAMSPDNRTLAVLSMPQGSSPVGGVLRLIDLVDWSTRETEVRLDLWPTTLAFSPDGNRLAVGGSLADDHILVVYDVSAARVLAQGPLAFDPLEIVFTPDGHSLMVYGARYPRSPGLNPLPVAARIRASDLSVEWEMDLANIRHGQYAVDGLNSQEIHDTSIWWRPAVVFAPELERMYLVHADADMLTTVDFAQRSRRTVAIHEPMTWLERLLALGAFPAYAKELNGTSKAAVLSADEKSLFVVGEKIQSSQDANGAWDIQQTSLGLSVIEISTGQMLRAIDTPATQIAWGPDARTLLLGGWDRSGNVWTDVVDTGNFEVQAHLTTMDLLIAVPVHGAPLIASSYTHSGPASRIQLLDTASWDTVSEWTVSGYADIWYAGGIPTQ